MSAVVRLESAASASTQLTAAQREQAASAIVWMTNRPDTVGTQIDFDARPSERAFYGDLLRGLRREHPERGEVMAVKAFAVLVVLAIAVVLLYSPPQTSGCSYSRAVAFTFARELSLEDAAQGRWDVLQPGYSNKSLALAYRYLSGLRLSDAERQALSQPAATGEPPTWPNPFVWLDARRSVPNTTPASYVDSYRSLAGSYSSYLNCFGDAFRTAVTTLRARQTQFGIDSPAVAEWVRAQDMVFQNCSGKADVIPPAAEPDLPPLIRTDRDYQIAAAHFYAAHFEAAEQAFRKIARDTTSPWHTIAPYLLGASSGAPPWVPRHLTPPIWRGLRPRSGRSWTTPVCRKSMHPPAAFWPMSSSAFTPRSD